MVTVLLPPSTSCSPTLAKPSLSWKASEATLRGRMLTSHARVASALDSYLVHPGPQTLPVHLGAQCDPVDVQQARVLRAEVLIVSAIVGGAGADEKHEANDLAVQHSHAACGRQVYQSYKALQRQAVDGRDRSLIDGQDLRHVLARGVAQLGHGWVHLPQTVATRQTVQGGAITR